MKIALTLLVIVSIARNTYFSSAYIDVLRGGVLLLVSAMAFIKLVPIMSFRIIKGYWSLLGYALAVLFSVIDTKDTVFVLFHAVSIASIILFSIACYESKTSSLINSTLFATIFWCYLALIIVSLMVLMINPQLVYDTIDFSEKRFRGVLPTAGMMGGVGAVLLGIALFVKGNVVIRAVAIISSIVCVGLTQSRTFWVAFVVASFVTQFLFLKKGRLVGTAAVLVIMLVGLASLALKVNININTKGANDFMRVETITNLTGRVALWDKAISMALERPFFGFGVTAGSNVFNNDDEQQMLFNGDDTIESARRAGKSTMHNGYLQSLLDVGLIGTFFYLSMILGSISSMFRYDHSRKYSAELFLLVFLSVANLTENVIYSVTVFNSALFFILAGFAAHLRFMTERSAPSKSPVRLRFTQMGKENSI